MTTAEDLIAVIGLACLTEDRGDSEQRALLRVARRVDSELNANVTDNHRMWGDTAGSVDAVRQLPPSRLEEQVHGTRVLVDDQREVRLPAKRPRKGDDQ